MKNSIKAIFVIIGTIIGAGFASGQEIYSFFNVYKENGIIGILISSIMIGIIIYVVLKKSTKLDISSYNELLEKSRISNNLKNIFKIIINIFLLMSFYIMVAGFSAYFKQEFNIPNIIAAILILIICYITFMKNIEGIANINAVIIPILIIIVIGLGFKCNIFNTISNIDESNIKISGNWLLKSVEYASYNSILLIPILISLKNYINKNEKQISIITTIIFFILSITIYLIMFKIEGLENIEIPLVYIANMYGKIYSVIYSMVVIFAIYTTMISAGYGFLNNCTRSQKNYKKLATLICISAVLVSNMSFSQLVNLTYPVFGILGFIQLVYILRPVSIRKCTKTLEKISKN